MGEKYDQPRVKNIIQISTFIDPRFKLSYFNKQKDDIINMVKEEVTKIQSQMSNTIHSSSSKSSASNTERQNCNLKGLAAILKPERAACITTLTEILDSEINCYIKLQAIEIEQDPLLWWSDHLNVFPNLRYLAEKYLIVSGTSVPSERVFSCAGNIITDTRACLSAEHAKQLILLSSNKHIC